MEEAQELCDRVAIMHKGRFVVLGTPSELMANVGVTSLDEAFIHYTGQTIEVGGSFKDIQRERQTARRLG
jgi:ABC-2 type transport system ATP-binding protein